MRINATYTNRIPSGGVSYAPFRHFVLLKKYIVYGQGPIACKRGVQKGIHDATLVTSCQYNVTFDNVTSSGLPSDMDGGINLNR